MFREIAFASTKSKGQDQYWVCYSAYLMESVVNTFLQQKLSHSH